MIININLKKILNSDFIFVLIFFSLSYRFFYILEFNSIGHHWDFSYPISSEVIQGGSNFFYPAYSYFKEFNIFLYLSTFAIQIKNIFLNIDKYGLLILHFTIHILSFYSIQSFLNFFFKKKCLFSGLFYSFSPFIFSTIVAGNFNGQIVYSVAPLVFVYFFKLLNNCTNKNFIICFTLNLIALGNLTFYIQLIGIILFYFIFFSHEKNKIKKILVFVLFNIIFNFWWLYIFFSQLQIPEINLKDISIDNYYLDHYSNSQNFISNFFGLSFHNRDFFNNILDIKIIYISLFCFVYYKIFQIKKNLFINFVLTMLLILSFLSSEIYSNLYPHLKILIFELKIFLLFRSPQNLLFLYPLLFSILFCFVFINYKKRNKFFLICIFLYPWIWEGDLGHDKLKKNIKNVGFIDFIKKDKDYINTLKYINKNYSYNSIIFYPYSSSPLFKKNFYQNINQGNIPEYAYLKPKVFHNEYKEEYLESTVKKNKNIKYIIVRRDITFHHVQPTQSNLIDDFKFIEKNKIEKLIGNFEIRKSNTYEPTIIKACNDQKCLSLKNSQIEEFSVNTYLIKRFKDFIPKYLLVNNVTLNVLAIPEVLINNLNLETKFIAYEDFQFHLLIGWLCQIVFILLCIFINNLKIKFHYARQ
jgi:hypothetical protein